MDHGSDSVHGIFPWYVQLPSPACESSPVSGNPLALSKLTLEEKAQEPLVFGCGEANGHSQYC